MNPIDVCKPRAKQSEEVLTSSSDNGVAWMLVWTASEGNATKMGAWALCTANASAFECRDANSKEKLLSKLSHARW